MHPSMHFSLTTHPTVDEKFYNTKGPKSYDYQHTENKLNWWCENFDELSQYLAEIFASTSFKTITKSHMKVKGTRILKKQKPMGISTIENIVYK